MGKTGPVTCRPAFRKGPERNGAAVESLICLTHLSSVIHRQILEQVTCARKGNRT
jgi:hypothetical protein